MMNALLKISAYKYTMKKGFNLGLIFASILIHQGVLQIFAADSTYSAHFLTSNGGCMGNSITLN